MAFNRDPNMPSSDSTVPPHGSTIPPQGSTLYERDELNATGSNMSYDRDGLGERRGGSNFWAFLIGGLVIALGLLAFLFYDGGSTTGRDVSTTSSTTPRVERPATPAPAPTTPAPTTPASPSAPAGPAR